MAAEKRHNTKRLISLDIDGTMEFGDPPGKVTVEWVRQALEQGHVVGSSSDRPVAEQRGLWQKSGMSLDFAVLKQHLEGLKEQFEADEYWHVGDGDIDQFLAHRAGFTFFWSSSFLEEIASRNGREPGAA